MTVQRPIKIPMLNGCGIEMESPRLGMRSIAAWLEMESPNKWPIKKQRMTAPNYYQL